MAVFQVLGFRAGEQVFLQRTAAFDGRRRDGRFIHVEISHFGVEIGYNTEYGAMRRTNEAWYKRREKERGSDEVMRRQRGADYLMLLCWASPIYRSI